MQSNTGALTRVKFSKTFTLTELQLDVSAEHTKQPQQEGQKFQWKHVKIEGEAHAGASHSPFTVKSWLTSSNSQSSKSVPVLTLTATQVPTDVRGRKVRAGGEGPSKHQQPPKETSTWECWEKLMSLNIDGTGSCLVKRQVNGTWFMFCTLCEHRLQQGFYLGKSFLPNNFTAGCRNFKSDSIHRHIKSSHLHDWPQDRTKTKPHGAIEQGFTTSQDLETTRVTHIIFECLSR